ncbi:MAG: hypothetical protein AAGM45_04910, partial [Cyanobacteria bacterium J06588_5]
RGKPIYLAKCQNPIASIYAVRARSENGVLAYVAPAIFEKFSLHETVPGADKGRFFDLVSEGAFTPLTLF